MSEATPEGGNTSGETPAADEFKPITSQEDFEKALGKRLERERAKYADYADLKSKAARLDELEEANKTEQQKLADRLAEAEKSAERARTEALRFKIASKFGVSDEDADLFLTGTDEETLTRQAERLAARSDEAGKPRAPKPDPNQGRPSGGTASTADQFAAAIESQFTR